MSVKSESIVRQPGDRVIELRSAFRELLAFGKLPTRAGEPDIVFWGARAFVRTDPAYTDRYHEADTWQLEEVQTP